MASAPETSFQSKQTNNKFISLEKNQIKSNKSIFPTLTLTHTEVQDEFHTFVVAPNSWPFPFLPA